MSDRVDEVGRRDRCSRPGAPLEGAELAVGAEPTPARFEIFETADRPLGQSGTRATDDHDLRGRSHRGHPAADSLVRAGALGGRQGHFDPWHVGAGGAGAGAGGGAGAGATAAGAGAGAGADTDAAGAAGAAARFALGWYDCT